MFGRRIVTLVLMLLPLAATAAPASAFATMTFPELFNPYPDDGDEFGSTVVVLANGNVVVTAPGDDGVGASAGAVYLFDGTTGALISALNASSTGDFVGSSVITLANGNWLLVCPNWDNGAAIDAGAVAWGSGATGVSGTLSAATALVGSTASDRVGEGGVATLANGHYVVRSPNWDNGALANAGAVTWGNGVTGTVGAVSAANSLVGGSAADNVGATSLVELTNGNYVVSSVNWHNGANPLAGAVTWCSGTAGLAGTVSSANSLVGSATGSLVGGGGTTPLANGNYVVVSDNWSNGAVAAVGAVTWCNGVTGRTGIVTAGTSLVGGTAFDQVGSDGVVALPNGHYVVLSRNWDNLAATNAGAVTWCNGTTGRVGTVAAANSLAGSTNTDVVGSGGITVLANGNYVVSSPAWDNGGIADAGAVTWASGTTGRAGAISSANSLVGSTASDAVGSGGIFPLTNGHFVVASPNWDNGALSNAGAATWCSGTSGRIGSLSTANSLVGSKASDNVGGDGVLALTNGNYVVRSHNWDSGSTVNAGAVTWGSGTAGVSGAITSANSFVGSSPGDNVGLSGVIALTNGNYVVASPSWDDGGLANVGAVTWGNGTTGLVGTPSAANSLVGGASNDNVGARDPVALPNGNYVVCSDLWSAGGVPYGGAVTWGDGFTGTAGAVSVNNSLVGGTYLDVVGSAGITVLANGNYVVRSTAWDYGSVVDAGAVTWCDGAHATTGLVAPSNSLVGSNFADRVGSQEILPLADGNYVVPTPSWDHDGIAGAGALTWCSGSTGTSGAVSVLNSVCGWSASTNMQDPLENPVHHAFVAGFPAEGGGRVRVGPLVPFGLETAADVPNDQGGWLNLTFDRFPGDFAGSVPVIVNYAVWRRVPGSSAARAALASPAPKGAIAPDAAAIERLRAQLPAALVPSVVNGELVVTSPRERTVSTTGALPPGTWGLVANVPALQQAQYLAIVPTVSNAAANDFVVTAHTTTPTLWFASAVLAGQSIDNLAPAQPANFAGEYSGGQTNLHWDANTEHDLAGYRLHRGTFPGFVPSAANLIASPIAPGASDPGAAGNFYKLAAIDVNGNLSPFALLTPGGTSDAGNGSPVAFALHGARPNPALGRDLRVAFDLPTDAPARLELIDASGRRVLARDVGTFGAGRHVLDLARERRVPAGIYWLRLEQGTSRAQARIAVIE